MSVFECVNLDREVGREGGGEGGRRGLGNFPENFQEIVRGPAPDKFPHLQSMKDDDDDDNDESLAPWVGSWGNPDTKLNENVSLLDTMI